jgi:HEAT repeat protein
LEPHEFGDFTRERVVAILKKAVSVESPVFAPIAATLLAGVDAQGPSPGHDLIAAALDVLARSDAAIAQGLLWQAAEHARNARVRVEAIRRAGPIGTPERSVLLRKWAKEGFQPIVNFQHDQIDLNSIREAAIAAIGAIKNPSSDDIETMLAALTPPSNQAEFSPIVFNAACDAYWSAGTVASLPNLVGLISKRWRGDMGASLTGLASKFSAKELKPHAEELRKACLESAADWPNDSARASRLVELAERLATPEFFQEWTSRYGGDGLEHGRGQVCLKLLEGFGQLTEGIVKGLLILARWPRNLLADGLVVRGLQRSVGAGHGRLVAETLIPQGHDGHRQLVESGHVFALYDSVDAALGDICGVLSNNRNEHERQRLAAAVASGALAAASAEEGSTPSPRMMAGRGQDQNAKEDQEMLSRRVALIEQLDSSRNPVAVVARIISPPTSSSGAIAVAENWLTRGEPLAQYVIRMIIREAGRANALGQEAPMLTRFEQCVMQPPQSQRPSMRTPLESALPREAVVDGRANRYALDLMRRAKLSFEKGAEAALNGIETKDDAQFVLNLLYAAGAIDVLTKSTGFHRHGQEALTKHVQATAISLVTTLLKQTTDRKRLDAFAGQLHERFQDLPIVRESAYRACGELGSFLSIKPLRERLRKETVASAKKAIEQAVGAFRKRLVEEEPKGGTADSVKQWLGFVADLGDPALVPLVLGYLDPPHTDHSVRHSALNAIEHMPSPASLEAVKKFIRDTAPEGQTLAVARHARLVLEERNDLELFDVLAGFYSAEEEVLDPAISYVELLGPLLPGVTKGLQKSLKLFDDRHWDEFVTRVSAVMESVVRLLFRRRCGQLAIDPTKVDTIAGGNYRNVLNYASFRNTYGKLQTHCDTIYAYRGESPTAHATHTDGSTKAEATSDDAEYVRDEFKLAFAEAVKALS